jgi:tRNA pseudouridine65 synthase
VCSSDLKSLQEAFMAKKVLKKYVALVRGFAPESATIDYPLTNEAGKIQEAITHFKRLQTIEIPLPFGKFDTSRYSLLELQPESGRMHQIRKHLAHIFHPIIGDRPHGCNKQNKFFLENWEMKNMLLHASELQFMHPVLQEEITIKAGFQMEFTRILAVLNDLVISENKDSLQPH